jgi:hypothetical protein
MGNIDTTELTLDKFNGLTASENCLLLLRSLMTGDGMTQTYELLKHDTLRDVVRMCEDLLDADEEDACLTEDERVEFRGYCTTLKVYYT